MKTLIAYSTKYGCTEKCAKILKNQIPDTDLINLKDVKKVEISKYNTIIIGGSIYIGKIRKEVKMFCNKYLNDLLEKRIGVFICGIPQDEDYEKEISSNFPKSLLDKAEAKGYFGGEFIIEKMNFLEKFILKKVGNITTNQSKIKYENINKFANTFK